MDDELKNAIDVLLTIVAMVGAVVGFRQTLHEWKENLRWKRAEHLEQLIAEFETNPCLRFSRVFLDWKYRTFKHGDAEFKLTEEDAISALRVDDDGPDNELRFSDRQVVIRDCLDDLLNFLSRVEIALAGNLVEHGTAVGYFSYWMERLVTMREHEFPDQAQLDGALERAKNRVRRAAAALGDATRTGAEAASENEALTLANAEELATKTAVECIRRLPAGTTSRDMITRYVLRYADKSTLFSLAARCGVPFRLSPKVAP